MFKSKLQEIKSRLVSSSSFDWVAFALVWCLIFAITTLSHQFSKEANETYKSLESIQARLESAPSYELSVLNKGGARVALLARMSSSHSQNIKFVSEATTEGRLIKEIPYSMPAPVTVSGSSLLHILDILHPSKEISPPADIWVKYLKIRKDRESFSLQMSLISRELKP